MTRCARQKLGWHLLCLCLSVFLAVAEVNADSYGPFCDFIKPDASGMRYAVVTYSGDPAARNDSGSTDIVICQRRPNADPVHRDIVQVTRVNGEYVVSNQRTVEVRENDIVHGRIRLEYSPGTVRVSSAGNGIAVLDCFGVNSDFLRTKAAVRLFTSDGRNTHNIHLDELFAGGVERFGNKTGSVIWCDGAWFDDANNQFVLISSGWRQPAGRDVAKVDLGTGAIQRGGTKEAIREIERSIVERNAGALDEALAIAEDLKLQSIESELPAILTDETMPLPARLRAAVILGTVGDKRGGGLLRRVALSSTRAKMLNDGYHQEDTVLYSLRHLNMLLGDAALPIHCDAVRLYGEMAIHVPNTFMPFGKKAVPHLISLARTERNDAVLAHTVYMLGEFRSEASDAVPVLIELINDPTIKSVDTRRYCVLALERMGSSAAAALPTLVRCSREEDALMRAAATKAIAVISAK